VSTVVSVLTTKDGQGSSTFALSLAWMAAEERRVMLVDADMSGTGTLADAIALDFGARGIGNLFGTLAVSPHALENQAVTTKQRPRLRIVPGLQGFSGPGVTEILPRLATALRSTADELVVLDLGAPLAHPRLESAQRAAEAICEISSRVFVVVQDSPSRLVKSIQVLKSARLPQAELIVHETRRGALRTQIARTLADHLAGIPISAILPWDQRQAARAEDAAQPISQPGLLRSLHLDHVDELTAARARRAWHSRN
jgi:MinD-like ATPase involved in chromosome partitioning or flagellar assembly